MTDSSFPAAPTSHKGRNTVPGVERYNEGREPGNSVSFHLAGHPGDFDQRPRHSLSWGQLQERRANEEHARFVRGVVFGLLLVSPFWLTVVAMAVRP